MTTKELVGPLPVVRFRDGTRIAYQPPRDTCDGDRWRACTDHRVACDCREAEMAEQISELRAELRMAREAALRILAGHPVYAYEEGPNGQREVGCQCTGCQIAREAFLLSSIEGGPHKRDETDGLTDWDRECERRWKSCFSRCPNVDEHLTRPRGKLGYITRDRGHYHDHLCTREGKPIREEDPNWTPWDEGPCF
jgi:hypothetical protein